MKKLLQIVIFGFSIIVYCQKQTAPENKIISNADTNLNNTEALKGIVTNTISEVATVTSLEVGITEGQLSVSLSGAATYNIPIAVPPGLAGVLPQISLNYNSQGGNGNAGYGWGIAGVSVISRIPSSMYHDGVIDAVDFDNFDRFALDGQRLIIKSGTAGVYGGQGTIYETENYSNIKVTSYGISTIGANFGPAYFIVEYPDGSRAQYGNSIDSSTVTDYAINFWQNPQGIKIVYNYIKNQNSIEIAFIKYGSPANAGALINEIEFVYKTRQRPEKLYVGGYLIEKNILLSQINVRGNNIGFRNYLLEHNSTSLGYERLSNLSEKTGDNTQTLQPLVFSYQDTTANISYNSSISNINLNSVDAINHKSVTGDFNGDGSLDFILTPNYNSSYSIFSSNLNSNNFTGKKVNYSSYNSIFSGSHLVGDLSSGFKLAPKQFWTIIKNNGSAFETYSLDNANNVLLESQKIVNYPLQTGSGCVIDANSGCIVEDYQTDIAKQFYSGDFNGDGLTDVIAIENGQLIRTGDCDGFYDEYASYNCTPLYQTVTKYNGVYFIDLDKRLPINLSPIKIGDLNGFPSGYYTVQVLDFNGDGKSDFMVIENEKVSVYSLNNNNQLELLCITQNISIRPLKPVLVGDYNGDGKSDFIVQSVLPLFGLFTFDRSYVKFLSNGTTFTPSSQLYDIPTHPYAPNYTSYIIPNDMNGDGKTDLILVKNYEDVDNNAPGFISIRIYDNMDGNFTSSMFATTGFQNSIVRNPLPIFLTLNQLNKRQEIGFITGTSIHYFQSAKDAGKDKLITKITNGNGVQEILTYKPLLKELNTLNSVFEPTVLVENYPKTDITNAPTLQVVSKIEKQSATVYKTQLFAYHGAVSDISGLGFLGFRATLKTNWFDDTHQIISAISKNDINLRGAPIENYTMLGLQNPWNVTPSTFITKTTTVYNQYNAQPFEIPLQSNKVFKLKQTKNIQFNGLENTTIETSTLHDAFNNASASTSIIKNNSVTEQTTNTIVDFENLPNGSTYIIGRPKIKNQTVTIFPSGDVSSSNELFDYQNNLLTQIQRRSTNSNETTGYTIEDNIYDVYGNITKKTITAPNLPPRVTSYEYNPTAPFYSRFMTKSTDIEGLKTTFVYDGNNGSLLEEQNHAGLISKHFYDKWFKKVKITDYLGKSKYFTYQKSSNVSVISTTADDASASSEVFDDLGRKITVSYKNINDNYSATSFVYDLYDRNYKTSEPYLNNNQPQQWSETKYDIYSRPISSIKHTGKIITIAYNGLTTTVSDGLTTKSSLKNAIGQVVSITDNPGGTINYKFFANGNLRQTIFDNAITTIEQDGYGRKIKLTDPSAGIFRYEYNTFGEITKESKLDASGTNPTGITSYNVNNVGKTIGKTVQGFGTDPTNTESTYNFDPTTKLITSALFKDITNGKTTEYIYAYDNFNRLISSTESGNDARFVRKYDFDDFGRILNEEYFATHTTGMTANQSFKNIYKNGLQKQIINNKTNKIVQQVDNVNARNQIIQIALGDNLKQNNVYDTYGLIGRSDFSVSSGPAYTGTPFLTLSTNFDAQRGNLLKRGNSIFNTTDEFDYDSQDRLIKYPDAAGNITFQDYDNKGKIKANSIGNYAYTIPGKPYQVSTVTPPFIDAPSQTYYEAREQNVQYNFFKSPISISVANKETIYFEYNDFNQRSGMFYGGASPSKADKKFQRFYSSDGSMEITYNIATDTVDFINYVGGDAYTAPLAIKSENDIDTPLYLHRDYQGSILAITDEQGFVLEARLFDAWGKLIKIQIGGIAVPLPEGTEGSGLLLDRGYTGHEHLLGVELINMNGRLYDPAFHRFLQPDNYVQDPSNTQNYNRYAYCYNNPLKFTDPSGEIIWFIIGAAVLGGVINWGVHGFRTDMEGLKAFGIGALAGTVGALTGGAAAAGLAGFQAGAVGAFFGSLISTPILSIGNNLAFGDPLLTPKQFIFGIVTATIMGGVISGGISALQGNNFWNGAPPRVAVEAITIKPVEIVSRTEMPKADLQKVGLPNTTKPSVPQAPKTSTSAVLKIEGGKIDLSNNPGFRIKGSYPEGHVNTARIQPTGTPNSSVMQTSSNGTPIKIMRYNLDGKAEYRIDFDLAKGHQSPIHGHELTIPGNLGSQVQGQHIPIMEIPPHYFILNH